MIYLDNAATSFYKPDCVPRAVVEAMQQSRIVAMSFCEPRS